MANELLTRDDIVRGKLNFDAQNQYMTGTANEQVTLPGGQKIKTRAGIEKEVKEMFPTNTVGMRASGFLQGQVPLSTESFKAANRRVDYIISPEDSSEFLYSSLDVGTRVLVGAAANDAPPNTHADTYFLVDTISMSVSNVASSQRAVGHASGVVYFRNAVSSDLVYGPWRPTTTNKGTYTTTTATSANVVVTSTGELQRSTSSEIFKKDIADITIPDYRAALKSVRPVSYRSTDATSDRTDWSWYSFIAEELGGLDKRLVQMDSTEFFEDTNEDGTTFINSRELPEGEYAANGINTNGIVALMVHINQQMLGDIEKLEDEKTQLKRRMTNLEKRMDALDGPAAAE